MKDNKFNPYEILEVDKEASNEDIKKAYKELSKKAHPDTGGSDDEFSKLKKAFDILTDPIKRNFYNEYEVENIIDIETEAKLTASQIAVQTLENLPNGIDIDNEINKIFNRCLESLKNQEKAIKEVRDKLQQRYDNIQKKPADDFLNKPIIEAIENHNRTIKQIRLNHCIHEVAFKLIQEYKFDITKIPFKVERIKIRGNL